MTRLASAFSYEPAHEHPDDPLDDQREKRHPETPTVRARIHVGDEAVGGDDSPNAQVVKVCKGCMRSLDSDADVCPECGEQPVSIRRVPDMYLEEIVGGKYRIVEKVGQGGMGEVYRARNDALGQNVAVKFLSKKFANDENLVARFLNEAKSYCRVNHPNAVTLLDYGQHDDAALYIITEFIEGLNVTETLKAKGPLPAETVRDVGMQIAEVLSAAHRQGVIHRDLKPDNIMMMPLSRGRYAVKVLDFGIAKIVDEEDGPNTETGSVFGTPEFMSPEQAKGDDADGRSDIYALGVIMFYMLTGKLPFRGKNKLVVLNMQVNDPPPFPRDVNPESDVDTRFEALIMKCLNKDRARRYTSADDLLEAFEDLAVPARSHRTVGSDTTPVLRDGWSSLDGEADTLASLETPRSTAAWEIDSIELDREQQPRPARGQRGRALIGVGAIATVVLLLASGLWWSRRAPVPPVDVPALEVGAPAAATPSTLQPPTQPQPVIAPATATPEAVAPEVVAPAEAEPVATEPVATEPVATEPVATEPVATEPVAIEPAQPEQAEPLAPEDVPVSSADSQPADPQLEPQPDAPEGLTPQPDAPEGLTPQPDAPQNFDTAPIEAGNTTQGEDGEAKKNAAEEEEPSSTGGGAAAPAAATDGAAAGDEMALPPRTIEE